MQKLSTLAMTSATVFKTLRFGCSSLSHSGFVKTSFHSLAPASTKLNCVLQPIQSPHHSASWQTEAGNGRLLSVTLQTSLKEAGVFSRSFSISQSRSAKELSDKGDIVYTGPISGMIKGVKLFSLSTSAIGICLQPMLFFSDMQLPTGIIFILGGMINFLVFLNPFIIHYIAKKYVTELRWNRNTGIFTATTWSLFLRRRELQFTADDVTVPAVLGMFTSLHAKGTPLFLDPQVFNDNDAYIHLMGFDKPLDWELPPQQTDHTEKEQSGRR